MFIITIFIFSKAIYADMMNHKVDHHVNHKINKGLQEAATHDYYEQRKADIRIRNIQLDSGDISLRPSASESRRSSSYGVILHAPAEHLPNYQRPSSQFDRDPIEEVNHSLNRKEALRQHNERLHREFVNQYIKNAQADGVRVKINQDKVVEDYNVEPRRNSASTPLNSR